ncbi:hypothetical protein Tco_0677088 [Tanacetum coccineum]
MERYNQTFKCTCERGDRGVATSRKGLQFCTGTDDRGMWLLYVEMTSGSIISSSYGIVNTSKLFSGNFNSSKLFSPDLPDCTNIGKGRVLKW